MGGCGRAAEFQRVGQDAGQHRALDGFRCAGHVRPHQVVHDRGGAGQRAHGDVDRGAGLDAACQQVMVDDLDHLGLIQAGGQFGGVVGVHDHALIAGCDIGDDLRLVQVPPLQHPQGLGVGFPLQDRLGGGLADLVQIPGPDDGGTGRIRIGGGMAEDLDHVMHLRSVWMSRAL